VKIHFFTASGDLHSPLVHLGTFIITITNVLMGDQYDCVEEDRIDSTVLHSRAESIDTDDFRQYSGKGEADVSLLIMCLKFSCVLLSTLKLCM
jgi:hypothetical protein